MMNWWKKADKIIILACVFLLLAGANALFSFRDLPRLVPMTQSVNQLPYQQGYPEEGAYPGALLPLMVSGKTVYAKNDIQHYEFDMSDPIAPWELVLPKIYYGLNSRNLLSVMGADIVPDDTLNKVLITDEVRDRCTDLGFSNDLFRYSCAANDIPEEYGNYFHYYYFYSVNSDPMHIYYGCSDPRQLTPAGDEDLVAIWQKKTNGFGEDLYLFSRDFYDREVQK